jgi:hypothetical protein
MVSANRHDPDEWPRGSDTEEETMTSRIRRWTVLPLSVLLLSISAVPVAASGNAACGNNGTFNTRVPVSPGPFAPSVNSVEARITHPSILRCTGTDPDGKNGTFVYVELAQPSVPDAIFAYNAGQTSKYGNYVRLGYYLCSWSGDTACGQGHGYFVSWSRRNGTESCVSNGAIGIHRLSGFVDATHTYKLVKQADGSVNGYIDGALVTTVLASAVACWASTGWKYSHVSTAAWDPGDQQGGAAANPVLITNYLDGGVNRGYLCGDIGVYRCTETASQAQIWTIDR